MNEGLAGCSKSRLAVSLVHFVLTGEKNVSFHSINMIKYNFLLDKEI